MKNQSTTQRFVWIAEALGYSVIFKRHRSMRKNEVGLTCPDLEKIYIDPRGGEDSISTLAHEIGHVLLLIAQPRGHQGSEDTDFDLCVGENAADEIGTALCRAIGHSPDFQGIGEKAIARITEAMKKNTDKEITKAFVQGYCIALADMLPSSEGFERIAEAVRSINEKEKRKTRRKYGKVQANGLRVPRAHRPRITRRREHS